MKPAKLKEHFVSLHPQHVSDNSEVFRTKKARFEKSGTLPQLGFVPPQKPQMSRSILQISSFVNKIPLWKSIDICKHKTGHQWRMLTLVYGHAH